MSGEQIRNPKQGAFLVGSSPRERGTRGLEGGQVADGRFIPAWAGNTATVGRISRTIAVHPRVGGEHNDMEGAEQ